MNKKRQNKHTANILKAVMMSILVLILGATFIYLQGYQSGYPWYFLLATIGVFFVLIALLGFIPLIIIWKERPKIHGKDYVPIEQWLLKMLQHSAVAIGSILIYITSVSVPIVNEATPYMYLYCVVSIIATIFGNYFYIRYYKEHRLYNPGIKDYLFKLGMSVIVLGIMAGGVFTSIATFKDIPYLSHPKQITLRDVTLHYESNGARMSVYRMIGYDELGNKKSFKLGHKAVRKLGNTCFDKLELTYLPNTNIMIELK